MHINIKTIEELKERAQATDGCECFIVLKGGARSSKQVWYFPESELWSVHNDIDDTDMEDLSILELAHNTNIVEAIKRGALFAYTY